jgi:hypothetical protein
MEQLHQAHQHSLIPIRIDVFSDDKTIRIVDTILFDSTVWPVPLLTPYEESLDENAWYWAQSVLGDAEVVGMGRTVRHFTGRIDLWSWSMLEKIHDCILPQLEAALYRTKDTATIDPTTRTKRKAPKQNLEGEFFTSKKFKGEAKELSQIESKGIHASLSSGVEAVPIAPTETHATVGKPAPLADESIQPQDEKASSAQEASPSRNSQKVSQGSPLIPIRIRMSVHGIRIHDDLWWDPAISHLVNPLSLAQSIGDDLRLAPEAIQAVALNIAEQIHGLTLLPDGTPEVDEGGPPGDRSKTTAAWSLDQRVHITNVAHLVAQHRPAGIGL